MPQQATPIILAEWICRRLELSTADNAEAACLVVAEEEAERYHAVGATTGQQTGLIIAGRIRQRATGHCGAYSGTLTHHTEN